MEKTYCLFRGKVKEAWLIVSEAVNGTGGPTPVMVEKQLHKPPSFPPCQGGGHNATDGCSLPVKGGFGRGWFALEPKTSLSTLLRYSLFQLICLALSTGTVFALPSGPTVISGTAGIATSGSTMTINNSANAIINWKGFSIGSGETARFIQPSALSAVLNRVTGGDPSKILGALQSNGRLLLINPNGILFGPNARVDVNGLIASTLNISNEDFLAGKMKFNSGPLAGKVENQGAITTPGGGQVYLIAADVENSGVITAPNGDVLLAAGKEVLLVDKNSPEIAVVVAAPEGQSLNLGSIVADAGRIGIYGSVVRQKGRISADSAVAEGGKIFLRATKKIELSDTSATSADGAKGGTVIAMTSENGEISGELIAKGSITAKGDGSSGSGGFVETSASKVDLNGFIVNTNGGTWLIDPSDFTIASSGGDITGSDLATNLAGGDITILSSSGATSGNGDIFVNDAIAYSGVSDRSLTLKAGRSIVVNQPITSTSNHLDVNLVSHYLSNAATGSVSIQSNIATNGGGLLVSGGTVPETTGFAIGYGMASNAQRYGVYLDTNAQITTSGGNINIRGQGVDTATGDADGISLWSGQLNAGGGNITLIGKAGDNQASSSSGVYIANTVKTTGAGTITIEGTGGVNTGTINRGIRLEGGNVSTENGLLSMTGTGGNAPGTSNAGISTNAASTIQTTGTGGVKLAGTRGNTGSKGIEIAGVIKTPALELLSSGNAVFSGMNEVNLLAASLTLPNSSLTYMGATGFTVGSVGSTTGVVTNNGAIILKGSGTTGTLLVTNNVNAGTADVQIERSTGGTGAGGIAIATGALVTGANVSLLALPDSGTVNVDGTVTGTLSVAMDAKGAVTTGASGLIKSDNISLVTQSTYTGAIGSVGTSLNTSPLTPVTGTTTFTIGQSAAGTPSGVNISHNGIANIGMVYLGTDAPFQVHSVGNLSVAAIATGTSDLSLASTSGVLSTGQLSAANINLTSAGDFSPSGHVNATNALVIDVTGAGAKFIRTNGTTVGGASALSSRPIRWITQVQPVLWVQPVQP